MLTPSQLLPSLPLPPPPPPPHRSMETPAEIPLELSSGASSESDGRGRPRAPSQNSRRRDLSRQRMRPAINAAFAAGASSSSSSASTSSCGEGEGEDEDEGEGSSRRARPPRRPRPRFDAGAAGGAGGAVGDSDSGSLGHLRVIGFGVRSCGIEEEEEEEIESEVESDERSGGEKDGGEGDDGEEVEDGEVEGVGDCRKARKSWSAASKLKQGWRAVKKTTEKSTASAVKSSRRFSRKAPTSFKPGLPMTPEERTAWEERQRADCEEWVTVILPAWRRKKGGPARTRTRTRTLAFRGIPPGVRGRVWLTALGNPLNITPDLFSVLKERARDGRLEFQRSRDTLDRADGDMGGHGGRAEPMLKEERSAHKSIMLDLPRTFPELAFFHAEGSPYEDLLREVLEAFIYLRPDIGYSQGMSFLAAVLILYIDDPSDVFACFANMLLHESCFLHFFSMKMPEVRIYLHVHDRFLRDEMPALAAYFILHGVDSDIYMINWVMSLYCGALPLDTVARIWDIYMLDGDVAIFRAALGILKLLQPKLITMNFEEMAYLLSHLPEEIEQDALLRSVRGIRTVTKPRLRELFRSCETREARASAVSAEDAHALAAAENLVSAREAALSVGSKSKEMSFQSSKRRLSNSLQSSTTAASRRHAKPCNSSPKLLVLDVTAPPIVKGIECSDSPANGGKYSAPSPPPLPRSPSPI